MGDLIFLKESSGATKEIFTTYNDNNEEQIRIEHNSFTNELNMFVRYDTEAPGEESQTYTFLSLSNEESKALVLALAKNVKFSIEERESLMKKLSR